MSYQTKYHKRICDGFRVLSFVTVVVALVSFVIGIWFEGVLDKNFFSKMFVTTFIILVTSGLVGIIFNEKSPQKSDVSSDRRLNRINTNHRLSQVVVHGGIVYISGQVSIQNRGKGITDQTTEILGAIEKYLADTGSDKNHMLSATVWLSDMASYDEFNKVWDAWVPQGQAPSRACVEAKLVFPDFNVEVAVIAAVKE